MREVRSQEIKIDVPGIIIISHGGLAVELLNSAKMICGEIDNVAALGVEPADSIEQYRKRLGELLKLFPVGVFVLADLMCGTPFNALMAEIGGKDLYGIAGANLSVLLEIAFLRGAKSLDEINTFAEEAIHASICNLNKFQAELLNNSE